MAVFAKNRICIKNILPRLAAVIILFHALILHPHSDELNEKAHIRLHREADTLIGKIRFLFHESHDENLDNLFPPLESVGESIYNPNRNFLVFCETSLIKPKNILESGNGAIVKSGRFILFLTGRRDGIRGSPMLKNIRTEKN